VLGEEAGVPAGALAQIMGHKPSALVERHYKPRSQDALRAALIRIESHVLDAAGIASPEPEGPALALAA
jgi:hypothetical protein